MKKNNISKKTSTVTTSSTVRPVYTIKGKSTSIDSAKYLMKIPTTNVQLNINNVKIEISDNVKDIKVTDTEILILLK